MSAGTERPANRSRPLAAIGNTKTLMIARYAGKTQRDVRRSERTVFSTTATWNCLGRQMIAMAASSVWDTKPILHNGSLVRLATCGSARAWP